MDTREILLGAAEHIERYGWIQLSMVANARADTLLTCATCAVGAIKVVALQPSQYGCVGWFDSGDDTAPALSALAGTIGLEPRFAADGITEWNDVEGRTAEDVVNALRLAAATVTE